MIYVILYCLIFHHIEFLYVMMYSYILQQRIVLHDTFVYIYIYIHNMSMLLVPKTYKFQPYAQTFDQ